MAMRRPRIKAVANIQLNAKRKPKPAINVTPLKENKPEVVNGKETNEKVENNIKPEPNDEDSVQISCAAENKDKDLENNAQTRRNSNDIITAKIQDNNEPNSLNVNESIVNTTKETDSPSIPTDKVQCSTVENILEEKIVRDQCQQQKHQLELDESAFKYPPKVDNARSVASVTDDVFYSDLEENTLQMDLQKSINAYPMSPTKTQPRQRIRATPIFGQRRNSFVNATTHSSGHEDVPLNGEHAVTGHRRERHFSSSSTSGVQSRHLLGGSSIGRIRTESGCSTLSETTTSAHKTRRTEDRQHRQHAKRDFEARFIHGVPDKSILKMFDLIYYNPATNPLEEKPNPNVKQESSSVDIKSFVTDQENSNPEKPEVESLTTPTTKTTSSVMPVPQLKLNANGELILDDKSLVIETTAEQEARKALANTEPIYLDEHTGMNGFYKRQKRTREWLALETIKFYRCLQTVGTDFSLMVSLFPNRSRRDLKLKFKKEERVNGALINKALLYPKKFNVEELKQQVEAEEEEERKRKQELLDKYSELKKTRKKKASYRSAAGRLIEGHNIYHNENKERPIAKRSRSTKRMCLVNEEIKEHTTNNLINRNSETISNGDELLKEHNSFFTVPSPKRKRNLAGNDGTEVILQAITTTTKAREVIQLPLKKEIIKRELLFSQANAKKKEEEAKQLEAELNQLLQAEVKDLTQTKINDDVKTATPIKEQKREEEKTLIIKQNISTCSPLQQKPLHPEPNETAKTEKAKDCTDAEEVGNGFTKRTITNLDDGTVMPINDSNILTKELDLMEDSCASTIDSDAKEQDIQKILNELAEGSLVLVSTQDPNNVEKEINEIYKVDKDTDELEDEPLNIPDNIIQCILSFTAAC